MASLYQNSTTKKWEFVFDYYDNGKRKQVRRKGFKSKREANDVMIDLQKQVQEDDYTKVDNITVGKFIEEWLENERKLDCDEVTFYNNKLYFKNHIEKRMGDIKLQNLNALQCQKFVNDMNDAGYARNTIDRVVVIIKKALDRAVIYKLIKNNCMRTVKLPKKQKKEMPVWTANQAIEFLQFTKDRRYHCAYALALLAGMRQGEILGLRWEDVDFTKKVIIINQTLTHYGKSIKKGAKTIAGVRTISIPQMLLDILQEQHEKYLLAKKGKQNFGNMVIFNLVNGQTVYPSNLVKTYIGDVKKSRLSHIPFHSMRHTHATMLIEKNVNVKLIAERLGHSKIGITLDTYSHVLPSMQQEVATQIDEIVTSCDLH